MPRRSSGIDAGTGTLKVIVSPADGKLHFDNLIPGEYQTQNISYTANTTYPAGEDIWLVFPKDGSAEAFEGIPEDPAPGPLGRFGHFALTSSADTKVVNYQIVATQHGIRPDDQFNG